MNAVELEFLLRDKASAGVDKIGAKVDALDNKARKTNASYKEMEGQLMTLRNVISMLESQLESLRIANESAPLDLDQSENIAKIKELEDYIELLRNNLKQLQNEAAQAKITPNDIPQAQAKFNGLHNSIQQMAREMPSLAMGPQTFFMAISNNLPIFTDQVLFNISLDTSNFFLLFLVLMLLNFPLPFLFRNIIIVIAAVEFGAISLNF